MTEKKDSSAMVEETTPVGNNTSGKQKKPSSNAKNSGIMLCAVAIFIALVTNVGLYMHGKHQADLQVKISQALKKQLSTLKQQSKIHKKQLKTIEKNLQLAQSKQIETTKELQALHKKIASISANDICNWLLAQADYLVKLAGHKLWIDQDIITSTALLKNADYSLADMDDPSVMNVRRALMHDINTLSAISQIDYDGIILKLNQLSNEVDNLRLADNYSDDLPMDSDSSELSSSLREWKQNLVKSWHNIMDDFITIRRRNNTPQPLLAPNQDVYLRENIRSRLLIAAQAVPRYQEEIYKQSLETISTWVRAWYETNDSTTKVFLAQLDELSQQDINMNLPDRLESQPLLEKLLMQTRLRNSLAQCSVSPKQERD